MTMISSSLPENGTPGIGMGRAWQRRAGAARSDAADRADASARADVGIEEEIWNRILKDPSLGDRYQRNIAVDVEDGSVHLRGHVLKPWYGALIEHTAGLVRGVVFVKNHLVADETVQNEVIQALLRDETTAPFIFTVRSKFGWVYLNGFVPSQAAAAAAEAVSGSVACVRGVLSLPAVLGSVYLPEETPEPLRRTLQPGLAAAVYQDGENGLPAEVGLVSQIIIDPCSRLVSALGVKLNRQAGEPCERLVPITAVEAVNERGVWLKEGETVDQKELFVKSAFPLPPTGWQPPFPYLPGTVRWSL